MKRIAFLLAALQLAMAGLVFATPASAQHSVSPQFGSARTVATESWIEEWDPVARRWVRVEADAGQFDKASMPTITTTIVNGTIVNGQKVAEARSAARYALPATPRTSPRMLAQYGPFVVTSETRVKMVGSTDSSTPRHFDAMMHDFPQLETLEMVEAPGTTNDIANLAVGRRIRAAGLSTHVPRGGSVRSGAVELFLAGVTRQVDDGAQFAVHSWLDNHGREADDFAASDPAHRLYLDYYVEMGMSERRAHEFYAMTNSVPHRTALWLVADDMRFWLRPEQAPQPQIAYLDVTAIDLPLIASAHFALARIDTRLDSPRAFP
ncbi:alpha/beta hydrolase [Erythrobacter sp. KY5]|uniref:alpha/beta hydrolase n=1 Tax=Erythrobacter sp. KY5 TaxID=2011159 RepID=UPI000DBEFAE8|nr:alpha/beta hydrolase [Erythrobacter sp. KY5]AWW72826.1 alpha/beta hydrolase [Erythrobacter sp. KY5]